MPESPFKDGTYEGKSKVNERGNYGIAKVTIASGKIKDVDFKGYLKDGTVKDENYGKSAGPEKYDLAQKSLKGAVQYAPKLVETQDLAEGSKEGDIIFEEEGVFKIAESETDY